MLVAHFVDKHARRCRKSIDVMDDEVMVILRDYHWPGHIRELENVIERAVVLTTDAMITRDAVTLEGAASAHASGMPSLKLRQNVEWIERETLRRALEVWPLKRDAARLMGISPRSLSYYLAKYPFGDQNGARP